MRTAACAPEDHFSTDHLLFEQEVACCRRQLYPAALKMTGNPADAEDLLQETLTRAYAGLDSFTPGSNAGGWLYRIMSNAFINVIRKRRREPDPVPGYNADIGRQAPCVQSAEDDVLGRFAHSEILDAVQALPECFKATVYLSDILGYSCKDVAEVTGVPVGTVTSRLHRARGRLRDRLAGPAGGETPAESVTFCSDYNRFRSEAHVTP
jgi:RNA polymerase sigma-70 factor, ECF subfamily